jgi:hypothetical protein
MDYPYIKAWGWMMGSNDSYIRDQVEKARRMKAPADAIYLRSHPLTPDDPKRHGESTEWATFASITHPLTPHDLETAARNHNVVLPHQRETAGQQS